MKYLLLLLLVGCRATDLEPDAFNVTFGAGDTDTSGRTGWRSTEADSDSQWMEIGWTWKLGDVADRQQEAEYMKYLYAAPIPVDPPKVETVPEPPHEEPSKQGPWYLLLLPTVGAIIVGVLNKRGKVDWLTPKAH